MLRQKIQKFLKEREFVHVATADRGGRPNAAPKFLLSCDEHCLYLADYTVGKTWENIKANPQVSISFVDTETLLGYQINGRVQILDHGAALAKALAALEEKKVSLSASRIIKGLKEFKSHKNFEVEISDRVAIFKVEIQEIVELNTRGHILRESLGEVSDP